LKVVFFGTPITAVPSLEALRRAGHIVPLVVTQPDRPVGRSRVPRFSPVKQAALDAGIEVCQPERVRTRSFRERIEALQPDVLAVVAYGRILGPRLLAVPSLGPVNVHFSLLPRYRGAAPVQWTLARCDRNSGVTTMRMNDRMDEGDILLERQIEILDGEHAPALQERLAGVGADLLVETLERLRSGDLHGTPQDDDAATQAPILSKADGEIDLGLDAREIEGRVRGFDPWPGVWLFHRGKRIRLVDARATEGLPAGAPPGTLIETGDGLAMVCGGGTLLDLQRIQPEGRRAMEIREAINGRQVRAGDRLEAIAGHS